MGSSGAVSYANLSVDAHRRNKTELLLKVIKSNGDWTLENKTSFLSHEQRVLVLTAIAGTVGAVAGSIAWLFNASYPTYVPWVLAAQSLMTSVDMDTKTQNYIGHKLTKMANHCKLDGSQNRQNLAKGLETIVKSAKEHTASRNAPEMVLSFTLFGTAIATWYERFQIPVLATGLAISSVLAWQHRTNPQNDLEKVSQNVDLCLNILEKERTK